MMSEKLQIGSFEESNLKIKINNTNHLDIK